MTPKQLLNLYNSGFVAVTCDPEKTAKLLGELPRPIFGAAAYNLEFSGDGKLSLPYKSAQKFDARFGEVENQQTGDCVSHAIRNAIDVSRAVEIHIGGQAEEFIARGATEVIYGSRGFSGEGMICSDAVKFMLREAGLMIRKNYPDLNLDLSKYNANIGIKWGSRGVPSAVKKEARKHPIKTISLITSIQEAKDAINNGYALMVCSNQGFSSKRDKYGIAAPKGSWAHAMCIAGCDDTRERLNEELFLIVNSWGKWNSGPKFHNQPEGSFWVRKKVLESMIRQRGTWAFSDVESFPARDLPDYGTDSFL